MSTLWCAYAQKCAPQGFASAWTKMEACVQTEAYYMCDVFEGRSTCLSPYPKKLMRAYTVCNTALFEGSNTPCYHWPEWTAACDKAMDY